MFTKIYWDVRRYTELEINFNAVERVVEYLNLDQEAEAITDVRPPTDVSKNQCLLFSETNEYK